jgi:hypothetical protein
MNRSRLLTCRALAALVIFRRLSGPVCPAHQAASADQPSDAAQATRPAIPVLLDLALKGELPEELAVVGLDGQPARDNLARPGEESRAPASDQAVLVLGESR